jgi:mono/diheme cytochrome c family protein
VEPAGRSSAQEAASDNAPQGLAVLYDFAGSDGAVVKDVSGVGQPLDLKIADSKSVRRSVGGLEVVGETTIQSSGPATKVIQAVRHSGEIAVEVWVRPANTSQEGPARIVTISASPNDRNLTLGQEGDRYDVRLRTTRTSTNGIPSVSSPPRSLATKLTHVVYSRERSGRTRLFVDGKQVADKRVDGNTSNWNDRMRIGLANEFGGERLWRGAYRMVAVYSRSLSPGQVAVHFKAGPDGKASAEIVAQNKAAVAARHFHTRIARLFARHCLECHDAASPKGGLDLSRRVAALRGGENGPAFHAGKPDDSLLWQFIESDEMPKGRDPLSDADKAALKQWIADGAVWPDGTIDPAVYAQDGHAGDIWIQRLTKSEYVETIRGATGIDISKEAGELLPKDLRADGFSNTAYNLNVDLQHVTAYARLAEIAVDRLDVPAFAGRFSRSRSIEDKPMRELVSKMGKWLLRGPLSEDEVALYRGIATTVAAAGGGYEESVSLIIEAMLQSPRFIYRIENQRGDGQVWPISDFELASRLSYILWGGPPDAELFKAADAGELSQPEILKQHVARMLEDRRAVERSKQFIDEWLNLGRLDSLSPNARKFPQWNPQLARDMRQETLAFFEEVAWKQNLPLSALLNTQLTFATPELAKHYRLPDAIRAEPANGKAQLTKYNVTSVPGRGGLLTQGSVLTVGGDEASMVSRGLFVLHELLRGTVSDPPPGVNTVVPPTKAGVSQRRIAEGRIADRNCGGCHSRFEPLAFGLEKFDGVGVWRDTDEHGNELRDDGEILFPGTARPVEFQSSAELMNLLAENDRVRESLTWKVAQFAVGRPLTALDVSVMKQIHETAQQNGGTYTAVIAAVVTSDLVLKTRTEPRERTTAQSY